MKFGPFEIKRFQERRPQRVELGATGTLILNGQLTEEEYNADLKGAKALAVYDKMRRSDGQVKAGLLACELPIRSANWDIKPASSSDLDQEIARYVADNLFDQMTITWDDFLRHVLLMLPFGFSVFEKVWELVGGRYRYRKLAPRLAKSIYKWEVDPEGGLKGLEQWVYKGGMYQTIFIPVEKLLVFTLGREGSNFAGISLLRAAYKHWYYKDVLYRIDGIAAERHGVGVALFKLPPGATTEGEASDYGKVQKIGESLHVHERSYVALPSDYEFDLKGVTGQIHDTMRSVEHHDLQIVRSILAQFINLGSKDVGSYALSADQSGFFLMALKAVGQGICDAVNRYGIPPLVDYNWEAEKYPKLVMSGLEQREMAAYSKAVTDFISVGAITMDDDIETELRKFLKFPPRKNSTQAAGLRLGEYVPKRLPRGVEVHVAFSEINDKMNSAEQQFVSSAKRVQARQIADISSRAINYIKQGQFDSIAGIKVTLAGEMAAAIEGVLLDLFEFGQRQVAAELAKQQPSAKAQEGYGLPKGVPPKQLIKMRANGAANVLASKLKSALNGEALRQVKIGVQDRPAMERVLSDLSDRELLLMASVSVTEAVNFGRGTEAQARGDEISRVVYSAIMDPHTCDPCYDQDGKEFFYPSPEWDAVSPPYSRCEGMDRCRCVGVYVSKYETGSVK